MKKEERSVIAALLDARHYTFSLLHRLLREEPTAQLLTAAGSEASLAVISMFESGDPQTVAMLKAALMRCRDVDAAQLDVLRTEYTRLFLGPEKLVAPPWESVYVSTERALFQPSTLAVRSWYRQYGYAAAGYPTHPDDHISLLLQFVALLSQKARVCLDEDLICGCRSLLQAQQTFESEHLLNWMGRWAQEMTGSHTDHLYPALCAAAAAFVRADHTLLQQLLDEMPVAQKS